MFLRPFGLYCSACFGSLYLLSKHNTSVLVILMENGRGEGELGPDPMNGPKYLSTSACCLCLWVKLNENAL